MCSASSCLPASEAAPADDGRGPPALPLAASSDAKMSESAATTTTTRDDPKQAMDTTKNSALGTREGAVDDGGGGGGDDTKTANATSAAASEENALLSLGLSQAELLQLEGRIRPERVAAQQANERIVNKQEVVLTDQPPTTVKKKKKKKRKDGDAVEGDEEDSQWVQCDECKKWRIIPSSVVESLPDLWVCADNVYDPKHSSCDAPEQTAKQVAKEKKRAKKRQRMMKAAAAAAAAESSSAAQEPAGGKGTDVEPQPKQKTLDKVRSPRPPKEPREDVESKPAKVRRASPVDDSAGGESATEGRPKKEGKKALGKRGRSSENIEKLAEATTEVVKPRGRGRPPRNPKKESTPAAGSEAGSHAKTAEDVDNQEWVQCEKCNKWRKLAPHVSADDLPDIWTCSLNTWNPASSSCDAPEDKADGLQDIGVFGSSGNAAGKLTYRNLIYGSTGRKPNRPVSERMRAAESLFAVQFDEDEAPTKVLYADSGAFVSRGGRPFIAADENDGMSVLELMSHSQLWQDLRSAPNPLNVPSSSSILTNPVRLASYTYHTLPPDIQQPVKDFLLYVLDTGTFVGDDVVRRARSFNLDSIPENLRQVPPFCTENVVITTLCELVKEGKVDCVQKIGANWTMKDWCPHYRRAQKRAPPPEVRSSRAVASRKRTSRCMKIAKPWKRAKT